MRILYVEDALEFRHMMIEITSILHYRLDIAIDGQQALARVEEQKPDLVICDLGLPDMSGLDLVKQLKAHLPDVPMIALTARVQGGERQECLDAGFDEYYAKPIDLPTLIALLQRYAERIG